MRLLIILLVLSSPLMAAKSVGQAIAIEGTVNAVGEDQQARVLKRGSSLYVGDSIEVAADSKAQLKFVDGGLVTLIANTQYRIDSYEFTNKKKEFSSELVDGGMRAMTGTIGKKNPSDYNIKTPVATIGVRGTILEALYQNGELHVRSVSGVVRVRNEGGTATLRPGLSVSTNSSTTMGTPSTTPPAALSAIDFTPPPGGQSLEQAQGMINTQPVIAPSSDTRAPDEPLAPGDTLFIPQSEGNPPCG